MDVGKQTNQVMWRWTGHLASPKDSKWARAVTEVVMQKL